MSKDLLKKIKEAAAAAKVTYNFIPELEVGEHKAIITLGKETKIKTKKGEEKECYLMSFEAVKGGTISQMYFPRSNWEERLKEMSEGRKPEDIPLLAILAKYGYVQDAIFESIFKDMDEIVTLPDLITFVNILIKEKEIININITKEIAKEADPETGEIPSYKKVWFK